MSSTLHSGWFSLFGHLNNLATIGLACFVVFSVLLFAICSQFRYAPESLNSGLFTAFRFATSLRRWTDEQELPTPDQRSRRPGFVPGNGAGDPSVDGLLTALKDEIRDHDGTQANAKILPKVVAHPQAGFWWREEGLLNAIAERIAALIISQFATDEHSVTPHD